MKPLQKLFLQKSFVEIFNENCAYLTLLFNKLKVMLHYYLMGQLCQDLLFYMTLIEKDIHSISILMDFMAV